MSKVGDKNDEPEIQLREYVSRGDRGDNKEINTVDDSRSHRKSTAERRLITKCDFVIVPLGALLYFVAYVDRNSIGNARVLGNGMQSDLELSDDQWSNCLSMFFVGYIVFMFPGNILLKKLRPNRQLGSAAIVFGALLVGMSAASNYGTVLAVRLLIGGAQAFMQGITIYCSFWYKRDEFATRTGIIYWAATISGAFSGLIAYAVGKDFRVDNTGQDSWRWLFIIEGSMAMSVGLLVWLILPPFPEALQPKTWLFSAEQVAMVKERSSTYNTPEAHVEWRQVLKTVKDPKSWAFASMNAAIGLGISSIGLFLPTFIEALGFSGERSQLFTAIPYACASAVIPLCVLSDRLNIKGGFLLGCILLSCVGYTVLLCEVSVAAKIVAVCIAASGLYTSIVLLQAWIVSNMAGYTKRATTWAMVEIFGQLFSIMGPHIYMNPPRFIKGHSIVLGLLLFAALMVLLLMWWMARENSRKEDELARYEMEGRVHPHRSRTLEEEQDLHVDFRYVI